MSRLGDGVDALTVAVMWPKLAARAFVAAEQPQET
jgi:hypothetical protein